MTSGDHGIELLVQRVACKIMKNLPPQVQIEDLFQSGMLGWIIAKNKYHDSFKIPFNNFAIIYIRGSIIDYLREGSWAPRSVCKYQRLVSNACHELAVQGIFDPTDTQIANYLNISDEKYKKIAVDLINIYFEEVEDLHDLLADEDTYKQAENQLQKERLEKAVDTLPLLERIIVRMHYNEEITIVEIAKHLNMDEYQARKTLKKALAQLKMVLEE